MLNQGVKICEEASRLDIKTGFPREWALPRLISNLYSQLGSIEYETNANGHGIDMFQKAKKIRQAIIDEYDMEFDIDQMRTYDNNLAVALMAEGEMDQAFETLKKTYHDITSTGSLTGFHTNLPVNLSICQRLRGRAKDARRFIDEALDVVSSDFGDQGLEMAT